MEGEAPHFYITINQNKQKAPEDKRQELRDSAQLNLYKKLSIFQKNQKNLK